MTTQEQVQSRRFDIRALPIALKITLVLGLVLFISTMITNQAVTRVVEDSQTESALTDLETISRAQALDLGNTLEREIEKLNTLANDSIITGCLLEHYDPDYTADASELRTMAITCPGVVSTNTYFLSTNQEFTYVGIIDLSRRVHAIAPFDLELGSDLTVFEIVDPDFQPEKWTWFDTAYNDGAGQVYITGAENDYFTARQTGIHLAVPVYAPGQPDLMIGVIYAIWSMENVTPLNLPESNQELTIVEGDGTQLGTQIETDIPRAVLSRMGEQPSGSFSYIFPASGEVLYGYTSIASIMPEHPAISQLDWYVSARTPGIVVQQKIAELLSQLRYVLVFGEIAIVVITAIFSIWLMNPLRKLTAASREIQRGNLDTPLPGLPLDEVGRLADVLRDVVTQLNIRIRQSNAAFQVSRTTAQTLEIDQLLNDATHAIRDEFDFPGVRIFLTDAGMRQARLHSAAGEDAERLQSVGAAIVIDEKSFIGRAILLGEPQFGGVTEQVSFAGVKARRPELAITLQASGRTLGALHILGENLDLFDPDSISILSLIADQIGSAIENVRLFEQSKANVAEIEALNRRLTRQAWEELIEEGDELRHTLDPQQIWPDRLDSVRARSDIIAETYIDDRSNRSVLAAPVILRGESIGTLAITRPAGETWTRDERILLESIAARLAMVAEGIRLSEEASLRAERERRVNEVSAGFLQRVASVDDVLQSALNQLSSALGSDHISLRLGSPPLDHDYQIGDGRRPADDDGQEPPLGDIDTPPVRPNEDGGLSHDQ
ncbi:MAG: GAF domain-containing protein [Anaerolineae bacterium]|nr:GAF domain-containing protein [Anaerolineae bacterium]